MTHRGPFQPLLFCDSVIILKLVFKPNPFLKESSGRGSYCVSCSAEVPALAGTGLG